jgi:dihydrodipicolinate synthase/N-acetylneuraminate lyase
MGSRSSMLNGFYSPLIALRQRKHGYPSTIIKAGLCAVGTPSGPVRPPLPELSSADEAALAQLIAVRTRYKSTTNAPIAELAHPAGAR